jgi:hypothetical protein
VRWILDRLSHLVDTVLKRLVSLLNPIKKLMPWKWEKTIREIYETVKLGYEIIHGIREKIKHLRQVIGEVARRAHDWADIALGFVRGPRGTIRHWVEAGYAKLNNFEASKHWDPRAGAGRVALLPV